MRRIIVCGAVALVPMVGAAVAQEPKAHSHTLVTARELTWGEPPPVFEKGMSFTVISGDPGKAGTFVVRLRMPAGYKIAPHSHPTDEHVTVLSGTLALGMGDTLDKAAMKDLPAGGYALLPGDMRHFAVATTAAIVQVSCAGPFGLTYVNPADDPTNKRAAGK
jgi:quercetin dioxygenase-like cupin family protein